MCKTCQRLRAAAFAVIRTIVKPSQEKDKTNQADGGGVPKVSDHRP